jgi:hypothetical protein
MRTRSQHSITATPQPSEWEAANARHCAFAPAGEAAAQLVATLGVGVTTRVVPRLTEHGAPKA